MAMKTESAQGDGEKVLLAAAAAYRAALGERLLAACALGSLAHGGFSPMVSDIDLGLVVDDPLRPDDPNTIEVVAQAQKAIGKPLKERLSVFLGTPGTLGGDRDGGRFRALDRLEVYPERTLRYHASTTTMHACASDCESPRARESEPNGSPECCL